MGMLTRLVALLAIAGWCSAGQFKDFGDLKDDIDFSQAQTFNGIKFGRHAFSDGQELKLQTVQDQPDVAFTEAGGGMCTMLMLDPDAISRQKPFMRYAI